MLNVCRITSTEQLAELRDDWDRLSAGMPLRGFAWHSSWWNHFAENAELFVLVVRDESQAVVGIAPWYIEQRAGQGRVIAMLGSGEVCSDYQSILVEAKHADAVTDAIADWLDAATDSDNAWDLLHLDAITTNDETMTKLVEQLWTAGHTVHREAGPNCWRIELPATWEEYVEALSKSHRKQVRRFQRRQLETGRATFHIARSEQELTHGFEILVELHQRRRQSLGQPGCFASPEFKGFLRDTASQLLANNQLCLSWIEIEGTPAAVEFQLSGAQVTYAYQAGVNPDLLDEEPGRIINIATIRHAMEQGQRSFDFLRGDEPYKAHWRAQPQATVNYRIVPRKALSQVRHGLWLAKDNVKQWVKSGLELTGMR